MRNCSPRIIDIILITGFFILFIFLTEPPPNKNIPPTHVKPTAAVPDSYKQLPSIDDKLPETTPVPTGRSKQYVYTGKIGYNTMVLICEGSGKPTILLESDQDSYSWPFNFSSSISQTCYYTRGGMLLEKPRQVRTTLDQVRELHELLDQAKISGPYIYVGYALAGYHLLLFTSQYPDEVVGLVCVDCRYPIFESLFLEKIEKEYSSEPNLDAIFKDVITKYHLFGSDPNYPINNKELIDLYSSSKQVMRVSSLGNRPFKVLIASRAPPSLVGRNQAKNDQIAADAWIKAGEKLSQLSTQGSYKMFPNTTHSSILLLDDVLGAIQEVFERVSTQ